MRRIVSVSIGSSLRDSKAVVNVRGEDFSIERIGKMCIRDRAGAPHFISAGCAPQDSYRRESMGNS